MKNNLVKNLFIVLLLSISFAFSQKAFSVNLSVSGIGAASGTYVPGTPINTFDLWQRVDGATTYYIYAKQYGVGGSWYWNIDEGDTDDQNTVLFYSSTGWLEASVPSSPTLVTGWSAEVGIVSGTISVIEETPYPEITLSGNATSITLGDNSPSASDFTEFVYAEITSGSSARIFTISNIGGADLSIGTITLSGANASDFSVTSPPSSTIAVSSTSNFTVTFNPSGEGIRTAIISIPNNDSDENPFTFTIQGEGFVEEDLNVAGITNPSAAIGNYIFQGYKYGYPYWKHNSAEYYIYNDEYSGTRYFNIDVNQVDDDGVIGNYTDDDGLFYKASTAATPKGVTAWSIVSSATGSPVITAAIAAPEIDLLGNSVSITNGDVTPGFSDHTHFGSLDISSGIRSRTFTIQNTGAATLTLSGSSPYVSISGSSAADFSITGIPSNSITAGNSTTFTVSFDASTDGDADATLTISSNDSNESSYSFNIRGSGFTPENIELTGVTDPSTANGVYVHQGILNEFQYWRFINGANTYYIYNDEYQGQWYWNIDQNTVDDDGVVNVTSDDDFLFVSGSTSVTPVTISSWSNNTASGHITSGTPVFGSREIYVNGNLQLIVDGDANPSEFDHTDFGSVSVASGTIVRTFTIGNTGDLTLNISGVTISGAASSDFTVNTAPASTVAGGSTTTFQVTFDPSGSGTRAATISIANNDNDENPYNFSIQGTGLNNAPVATAPSAPTIIEDATNVDLANNIQVSDTDGDNQTVTFTITGGTLTIGTAGSITFPSGSNGSNSFSAAGTLADINIALDAATFTPTPNLSGTNVATISFTTHDGAVASSAASVTFSITAINDDPSISGLPTDITVSEDIASNVDLSAATLSDVDAGSNSIVLTIAASAGTLTASSGGSVTIGGSGTGTLSLTGTVANIDTYLNTSTNIKYTGLSNANGNDAATLTLTANDGGSTGTGGGTDVSLGTVNVDITALNDAPTLTSFSGVVETTNQNTEVEITLAELKAQGDEADVDGTVDAFIVNALSTGTLNIGATSGTAGAFNASTNNTINAVNNAYWTPATDAYGTTINAFTTTVKDNLGAESIGAVQATVQVNDVTNPEVSSISVSGSPLANATSVSFAVTFNESVTGVDASDFGVDGFGVTGSITGVTGSGSSYTVTVGSVSGTGTLSIDLNSVGTGIADGASNAISGGFTAGGTHAVDTDAPTLSSSVPADDASGVFASADITLTFSEDIVFGTGNILINDLTALSTNTISVSPLDPQASILNNVLTLNPTSDLIESHSYAIQIAATAIYDVNGNSYAGILDDVTLNFGVADITAPLLVSNIPSDDATNATLSGDIVLSFDDNMVKGTGNITIRNSSDNSSFEVIDVTSAQVSIAGMDVTIDPNLTLLKGTAYYIEIDATAFVDDAGNPFNGITGNSTLNFTTIDVVINEVVTEPQTDWSTTSFNGSNGGGAITNGTDEWVELFINSDGVDLSTGWTIEVSSQAFSGSLNAGGAFQTIYYVGTGTINNTDIGDFLVLGNPIGSFYMNLTTTITLKDPGGAIVDEVSFGASPLPSCDSDDENNESAQRFVNGSGEWTQGIASLGAANTGPSVTLSVSETAIAEAAGTSTITATLSAICSENVTVSIGANASSTAEASDYTLAASILITAGNLTGTTVLTALQDSKDENNETVVIDITGVTNGTEAGDQQQTVTITDDDDAPTVYFNSTASSGLESVSSADVQVEISAESGLDVTVNYTLTGTAAGSGTDYTLANGTLTITAGSTSNNITIASIVEDIIDEYDETVIVTLSGPGNATLGTNTVHTYTILDNDNPPLVSLDVPTPLNIAEASGISTITASLSTVSGKNVTVNLAFTGTAVDGAVDYNYSSSSITIPAGSLLGTSTITAMQDALDEDNETIIIDIDNLVDGTEDGEQQVAVTITDDDDMPTVTFTSASQSSTDETGSMTITAELSAVSGRDVTVPFTVNGASTATGGGTDYSITASPIAIAAGNSSQAITITIATDALDEYNETVIVDMGTLTNATQGTTTTHTATITDDDLSPLVSLTAVPVSIAEASGVSSITAILSEVSAKIVTVDLAYTGTATGGGTDYTASGSSIVINPGATTGQVSVTAVQDLLSEGNETVIVDISTITNGTEDGVQQQTITIVDDDLPLVSLSQSTTSFDEAAGINTITATLANTFPLDVTVTIGANILSGATGGGTDYSLSSTTITIFAGLLTGTATLTAVQDLLDEDNESVIIDIISIVNGVENGVQQVTSTITDDDTMPTVTFTSASQSSVAETGTMTITAQLSAISGRDVTVPFTVNALSTATGGGTDYSITASPITIIEGNTSGDIIITIATDALDENNETIVVDMGAPLNASAAGTTSHTATITDDDATPTIAFNSVSSNGLESVSSADLQVDLSAVSGLDVSVNYTITGDASGSGTDYTLANGTLTISAGNPNNNITIAAIVNDLLDENNETVVVTLSSPVNATLGTNTVHTYTITDDDPTPIIAFNSISSNGDESVASANLQVDLSAASGLLVTVDYTVTGTATGSGTDYTLANGVLTINAGDVNNNITIASIVNDLLDENNETVVLTLSNPVNAILGTNTVHTYTINDNDATPTVSFTTASQSSTAETGTMTITAQLSAVSGLDVTLPFTINGAATATNGTDYSFTASPVSILAGNTSANIIITINEDDVVEVNETIIVDMGSATNATPASITTHTATITNDDYAILTIEATQQATEGSVDGQFTISTNKQFDSPVAVDVDVFGTATEGADYSTIGTSVNFSALTNSINISVDVIDDALFENDETIVLGLTATNNTSVGIASAPDSVATIIITDDEVPPLVNFTAATQSSIGETGVLTITAKLSEVSGLDVTVPFTVNASSTATGGGVDYTISTSPITIAAGQLSADINITIAADVLDEYNETVVVNMGTPVNATQGTVATHTATITDDDAMPTVTFVSATQSSVNESGTMTITAVLSAISGRDVVVPCIVNVSSTASASDYSISAGSITFVAGDLSEQITISINEDDLNESNETVIVNMGAIVNATPGAIATHTATITNDDFSSLRIETALDAYEGGSDGAFWIITDTQVDSPFELTISLLGTATSGVDYVNISSPLIFPANTDTLTVAVTQIDDLISEPGENVIMNLVGTNKASVSVASAPDSTATTVIYDNDILQLEIAAPVISLSKTYDGNNTVAIIPGALTNLHPGDDVTVTATATYDDAMVGTGKTITVHYTISGADIAMYYSPVDEVYNAGVITKAQLMVKANKKTKTYGNPNPVLTYSYRGWVNGVETIDEEPHIRTAITDSSSVGYYFDAIKLSGGSDNNYELQLFDADFRIDKAILYFTANSESKTYGQSNPNLSFVYNGFVNNDNIDSIDVLPVVSTLINNNTAAGFYEEAIVVSGGSDNNYKMKYQYGDFEITKALLSVHAQDQSKYYGQVNPELTFKIEGFVNGDTVSSIDLLPVAASEANTDSPTGSYPIIVSGGLDNNYNFEYFDGVLSILERIAPSLSWETPAPIYYGTALGIDQLNATADISGSFTYSPSIGTVLDAGQNQQLNVVFIPNDTLIYQTISKNVFIDVLPVQLTVTANSQSIVIGQQIPELTYQIEGFVNGEGLEVLSVLPQVSTEADENSQVGVYPIIVEGAQAQNYQFDYIDATLSIVEKQVPVITWLTPDGIQYGTALSDDQLNATANIAGSFSYNPVAGTILNAGNAYELTTTFNPDDAVNYQAISKTVYIDVAKAELTVTATDTTIKFGDPIPVFKVSYQGFINNDSLLDIDEQPKVSTTANSNSAAGKYEIIVSGGTDNNYNFVLVNGILTIETETSSSNVALFNAEVFPNPFTEVLNIQINQEIQASYIISTLIGKVLIHGEIDESDTQIELPDLRKGVYLLHLKHNEFVKTFRIVKL